MIVDSQQIFNILEMTKNPSLGQVQEIIAKAKERKGLTLEEAGILLNTEDEGLINELHRAAREIKMAIYGPRLVLFAPLYISSYCVNDCEYCGFHCRNKAPRRKLSLEEVKEQVEILEDMGHKRLLLEFGEDSLHNPIDYVVDIIKAIYSVKHKKGSIRRVNVNIAATTVENYKKLKSAGIGTYQLFQETYHEPTYKRLHRGPKADYERQITAPDRAFEAGIDDVGIGVLFGLYNYKFEVLGLVSHAEYLDKKYGAGPHTISVPRFQPADSVDYQPEHKVADKDFLKLISILRMAVPYTGMIMSTRETPALRRQAFDIGISQTSAASRTSPGGYYQEEELEQFSLSDHRSLDEVVQDICQIGYFPSFCTACYRVGRTGDYFMEFAKSGNIQNFCQPNAILTFKEYLLDYASRETCQIGEEAIKRELLLIPDENRRRETKKRLLRLEQGERDLYF